MRTFEQWLAEAARRNWHMPGPDDRLSAESWVRYWVARRIAELEGRLAESQRLLRETSQALADERRRREVAEGLERMASEQRDRAWAQLEAAVQAGGRR